MLTPNANGNWLLIVSHCEPTAPCQVYVIITLTAHCMFYENVKTQSDAF